MRFEALTESQKPTTDHAKILDWAKRHGAVPAEAHVRVFDGQPTMLRFLFNDLRNGTTELRPITWDDFFARFDVLKMSVLLDEEPSFEFVLKEGVDPLLRTQN